MIDIESAIIKYLKRNKLNSVQINTALVDMDGVLYDSMKNHTAAWFRLFTELGVKCVYEEFYLYEGMTAKATFNKLFNREFGHGVTDEQVRELYQRKIDYFRELPDVGVIDGTAQVLNTIKSRGLNMVLVTGSAQGTLLEKIDTDYPNLFKTNDRVTALDVTNGKPHPEPYIKGMGKVNATPTECIVIENAPLGVQAGHAAGCFTCAITTGPIARDEMIKSGADIVFDSMEQFAANITPLLDALNKIRI
ncbi:MAG: HAD-IA family hydrolase [Bacteroidales bacterium]